MINTSKVKLGVIADDFTGAADAASFLQKSGYKVILLTEVPDTFDEECDCLVVALKIRSVNKEYAIKLVSEVMDFFMKLNIDKYYFKYCSTFDSTKYGNIGIVLDYLMERINQRYTVICPSLPANGRTVKDGNLYVNGVPLDKSAMKNHPLNPMWDSYIPNLMKCQSKYQCYESALDRIDEVLESLDDNRFYLIPDYNDDIDGKNIAKKFVNLSLLSGGSGLLEHLDLGLKTIFSQDIKTTSLRNKAIVLSGSCSSMTKKQVEVFKKQGNPFFEIKAKDVYEGNVSVESIFNYVLNNLPETTIVYSDCMKINEEDNSKYSELNQISQLIENIISSISKLAIENEFDRIIVAGGETSGSVVLNSGYNMFLIGKSVAPGVPLLMPVDNSQLCFVLKSGNFGDEGFFSKAIDLI